MVGDLEKTTGKNNNVVYAQNFTILAFPDLFDNETLLEDIISEISGTNVSIETTSNRFNEVFETVHDSDRESFLMAMGFPIAHPKKITQFPIDKATFVLIKNDLVSTSLSELVNDCFGKMFALEQFMEEIQSHYQSDMSYLYELLENKVEFFLPTFARDSRMVFRKEQVNSFWKMDTAYIYNEVTDKEDMAIVFDKIVNDTYLSMTLICNFNGEHLVREPIRFTYLGTGASKDDTHEDTLNSSQFLHRCKDLDLDYEALVKDIEILNDYLVKNFQMLEEDFKQLYTQ